MRACGAHAARACLQCSSAWWWGVHVWCKHCLRPMYPCISGDVHGIWWMCALVPTTACSGSMIPCERVCSALQIPGCMPVFEGKLAWFVLACGHGCVLFQSLIMTSHLLVWQLYCLTPNPVLLSPGCGQLRKVAFDLSMNACCHETLTSAPDLSISSRSQLKCLERSRECHSLAAQCSKQHMKPTSR